VTSGFLDGQVDMAGWGGSLGHLCGAVRLRPACRLPL